MPPEACGLFDSVAAVVVAGRVDALFPVALAVLHLADDLAEVAFADLGVLRGGLRLLLSLRYLLGRSLRGLVGCTFGGLVGDLLCDRGLLGAALAHAVGEAFDGVGVEALLAEILAGEVDLGLLSCAADGDISVLAVGLPAARQDAARLGGEALALVDVDGVGEGEVAELARVDLNVAGFALIGLDRYAVLVAAGVGDRAGDAILDTLLAGYGAGL